MPGWLRRGPVLIRVLASFVLALSIGVGTLPTRAQEPEPEAPPENAVPEVGSVFWANPLLDGTVPAFTCPTGRNTREQVGEGYIFKVTGRCTEDSPVAAMPIAITDIMFPDGEIKLEVKVVSGHERASFGLLFRYQQPTGGQYEATIIPASGWGILSRDSQELAVRRDLGGLLARDDWNTVAIRARGADLWMLVNDQLVAQASDPTYDRGRIIFGLRRLGELDDVQESAAVIRNVQVSLLAQDEPERAPTFE